MLDYLIFELIILASKKIISMRVPLRFCGTKWCCRCIGKLQCFLWIFSELFLIFRSQYVWVYHVLQDYQDFTKHQATCAYTLKWETLRLSCMWKMFRQQIQYEQSCKETLRRSAVQVRNLQPEVQTQTQLKSSSKTPFWKGEKVCLRCVRQEISHVKHPEKSQNHAFRRPSIQVSTVSENI